MNRSTGLSLVLMLAALQSVAATPDSLGDGMRKCAQESDTTQRLQCFDTLAASLPKLQADKFGMTADIAHKRDPVEAKEAKVESLTGKIVALRQAPRGELIFTLDNDQVWIQSEPGGRTDFLIGDSVRIEHGALSALFLAANHGRRTKVKRVS
jgi:hypothetical protein